jgi:hypothetical protein
MQLERARSRGSFSSARLSVSFELDAHGLPICACLSVSFELDAHGLPICACLSVSFELDAHGLPCHALNLVEDKDSTHNI